MVNNFMDSDELNLVEDFKLEFGFLIEVVFMDLGMVVGGGMMGMGVGMFGGGDYGMFMFGGGMGGLMYMNDQFGMLNGIGVFMENVGGVMGLGNNFDMGGFIGDVELDCFVMMFFYEVQFKDNIKGFFYIIIDEYELYVVFNNDDGSEIQVGNNIIKKSEFGRL